MDLPMRQGQPTPAPQAQGQPTPAPQGRQRDSRPFPASKGEALQFSNDLLQILYDERTHANIVKQLDDVRSVSIGPGVGLIAGHLVGGRIADVRAQTGRQIEMKLVVDAVQAVVRELGEIAAGEGFFEMTPDDQKVAVRSAVQMLDKLKDNARRPQA